MSEKITYLTPVGRAVTGDLFKPNTKNMQGEQLTVQSGPNKGNPTQEYIWGLAFPKNDPVFYEWYCKHIDAPARKAWPQWYAGPINNNDANYKLGPIGQPQCTHPQMSLKIRDGDGLDGNGKPWASREGYAGHWVLVAKSSFAPGVYYVGQYPPQHKGITDPGLVRRGWYYRMGGTIESNNNPQKPGLYVNLNMVDLCAQGQEIVSGPDAATVFGSAPVNLPAGAIALPAGGAPMGNAPGAPMVPGAPVAGSVPPAAGAAPGVMPGMPAAPGVPMPSTPAAPGGAPVYVAPNPAAMALPGGALPAMPGAPVMPAPGGGVSAPVVIAPFPPAGWAPHPTAPGYFWMGQEVLTEADLRARYPAAPAAPAAPMAPAAPVVPAAPTTPVMTAKAAGATYEQFVAGGWTPERMRADGYLV